MYLNKFLSFITLDDVQIVIFFLKVNAATACATWSAVPTVEHALQTVLMITFVCVHWASGEPFVKRVS